MDHVPTSFVIHLPDGRVASEREMRNVSTLLQLYVRTTEEQLPDIADNAEHDRIVDFLRLLARRFNEELRLFRAAEAERREQAAGLQLLDLALWTGREGGAGAVVRH